MRTEKLATIVTVHKGRKHAFISNWEENATRVLQINDLRNDDNLKFTLDSKGVIATKNDILIAWDGANAGTIGFGKEGFVGSTLAVLRLIKPKEYYPEFVGRFLRNKSALLRARAFGATIPHIERKVLDNLNIPQIPLPEQIRIATLLSRIEMLAEKRRESLRLLDNLMESQFREMFGDDSMFQTVQLSKVLRFQEGLVDPQRSPYSDMYHVGEANIESKTGKFINLRKAKEENLKSGKYQFTSEHILYCKIRPSLNKVALPNFTGICSADIYPLKPITSRVTKEYLKVVLGTSRFLQFVTRHSDRTSIPKVNREALGTFILSVPPLDSQLYFSSFYSQIEKIKDKFTNSLTALVHLYASTSHRAFQGALDLSALDVSKELLLHEIEAAKGTPSIQESMEAVGQVISRLYRQIAEAAKPLLQVVSAQSKIAATMAAFQPAMEILKQFQPLQKQSLTQFKALGLNVTAYQKVQKEWAQSVEQWANKVRTFEEFWEEEILPENYEERKAEMYAWLREGFLIQEFDSEKRSIVFKIKHLKTQ